MTGEFAQIARLRSRFPLTGDDCAVLPAPGGTGWWLLAADAVVAGVHGDPSVVGLDGLAWRAVVANVSDVAAMGGRPRWLLATSSHSLSELQALGSLPGIEITGLWVEASGRATLYTWSVVFTNDLAPFSARLPYVAAVVDLEEGVRLMTNIVDCPAERLEIGMPLVVDYRPLTEDITAPVFRPA